MRILKKFINFFILIQFIACCTISPLCFADVSIACNNIEKGSTTIKEFDNCRFEKGKNTTIDMPPERLYIDTIGESENDVNKDVINIAMASDNNYTYPLIVAMTSILENKSSDTKIDFYIMLSGDFIDESKTKIMSLQKNIQTAILH